MEERELRCKTGRETCVFASRGRLGLNTAVLLVYLLVTKPAGYQSFATECAERLTVARSTGAARGKDEAELSLTPVAAA